MMYTPATPPPRGRPEHRSDAALRNLARIGLGLAAIASLTLAACGDEDTAVMGRNAPTASTQGNDPVVESALVLRPRLELVGLGDIFEALRVTRLSFTAELFLLPEDVGDGDAIDIRFDFRDGVAATKTLQRDLHLDAAGRYRILLRLHPAGDDAVSVNVEGRVDDGAELIRQKADEPAPSPAEPAPSPADEADEPAPSPAEPAPSPADEADEPAPSPAEPAPSPARQKADDGTGASAGEQLSGSSPMQVALHRSFEFYAGTVQVASEDTELVVLWDIRGFLRVMLAEPLGLPVPPQAAVAVERPGFEDTPADFRLETR